MHFEILVEDQSGKIMLEQIVPRLIGGLHTCRIIPYKGIGRIPKNMQTRDEASKRILLEQLPRLLDGYGKTYASYPVQYKAAVVVVCDLDRRCLHEFRSELFNILERCQPRPIARFCIAIEEGEAWLLGEWQAVKMAYPKARIEILQSYVQDSICGTWEKLADAVTSGGSIALARQGWQRIGAEKSIWAQKIPPHMDLIRNQSPSFQYFKKTLSELIENCSI